MTLEKRVERLERLFENLQESFIQAQANQVINTAKTDDNTNKVNAITPYTETKIGYYGETYKTFYDVPEGNVTVYFDNYQGDCVINRSSKNIMVSFEALTVQTNITISIQ